MAKSKLRIFIIDDDEVNNFVLMRLVKERGIKARCSSVTDGQKALQKLRKWDIEGGGEFPDIILLDLDMPCMDGFQFLDAYQEELYKKYPKVQVYMLSSSIRTEDKERAKSYASVNNFISKPLPFGSLKEIVRLYEMSTATYS